MNKRLETYRKKALKRFCPKANDPAKCENVIRAPRAFDISQLPLLAENFEAAYRKHSVPFKAFFSSRTSKNEARKAFLNHMTDLAIRFGPSPVATRKYPAGPHPKNSGLSPKQRIAIRTETSKLRSNTNAAWNKIMHANPATDNILNIAANFAAKNGQLSELRQMEHDARRKWGGKRFYDYTGGAFDHINPVMRGTKPYKPAGVLEKQFNVQKNVEDMFSYIRSMPKTTRPMFVYRGLPKAREGMPNKAFVSTTENVRVAQNFAQKKPNSVVSKILIPAGTRVIVVAGDLHGGMMQGRESEIILAPGTFARSNRGNHFTYAPLDPDYGANKTGKLQRANSTQFRPATNGGANTPKLIRTFTSHFQKRV